MWLNLASVWFVIFLAAVGIVAYITPRKFRYIWLLIASYGFYVYNPSFGLAAPESFLRNLPALGLLIGATVVTYLCALAIEQFEDKTLKRLFLGVALGISISLLVVCKYYNFLATGIEDLFFSGGGATIPRLNIIVPLGISYYTMQAVGYILDVYFGALPAEKNPARLALFVSFFPSIVTGPINRAKDMLPQYTEATPFSYDKVAGGLFRILWGFFKFYVLAGNLAQFVNAVFGSLARSTGPELLAAGLAFSYQLYINFSGSCDIAIGAATALGYDFSENFNRPFAAKTYSGLWQRWHISLTSFFRDYVFTPLVWSRWPEKLPIIGKKVKKPPMFSSTVIIFALSGLWHGPSIYYLVWGLLNGFIMATAKLFNKKREKIAAKVPIYRNKYVRGVFQRVFVYLMFTGCLIFFAAALYEFSPLEWAAGLGRDWNLLSAGGAFTSSLTQSDLRPIIWLVMPLSAILVEVVEKFAVGETSTVALWVRRRGWLVRWTLYFLLLLSILLFAYLGQSKFIYQQY